jgi:chromosomal replication initiator protein
MANRPLFGERLMHGAAMAKATVIAEQGGNGPNGFSNSDHGCGQGLDPRLLAARVAEALRKQLGDERYAVWFGEAVSFDAMAIDSKAVAAVPAGDVGRIVVSVSNAVSQDWLKRTFSGDVEAAVRAVCGPAWSVTWQTASATPATALVPVAAASPTQKSRHLSAKAGPPEAGRPRRAGVMIDRNASRTPESPTGLGGVGSRRPAAGLGSFVVGPSNRMAFAAVEIAAARPGEMSPLVIHGPSGVGKSHLLEGICGRFRELHPGATTLLLSAEQFTTSFLQALHGSGLPGFRRGCRNADLLVIDDLQFFAGKRATLMEVQQTVDALHRQGRQMVFASDRDLAALDGLGPELLTRLRGGMSARIEPPDYDVRRGIVAAVAVIRGLSLPDEVIHYVATHMTRHARELIGGLNRLEATSHMLGLPITFGMAEEALTDLVRSSARSVRLADIERAVCAAFGIESGSLQSARRARTINHPRMLAMFLARRHTTSALTEIGSYFGRRSHSTVISAQKTVDEWVAQRSRIVLADTTWDVEEAIRRVEDVLRAG